MAICNRMKWLLLPLLVASRVACAQETVEDRMAVLNAQIDILTKEAERNKLLRTVAGTAAMGLPVVLSVSDVGGVRMARLQLANGSVDYFREGEQIQNSVALSAISGRQVFVKVGSGKGAKAVLLSFAARTISTPGGQQQAQSTANDALLPSPPVVKVPAIDVIPTPPKAGK